MTKKKESEGVKIFSAIGNAIRWFFVAIWKIIIHILIGIKYIFILIERSAKTIAIFIVSIAFLILALSTSFYLFSSTFGMKESPVFQELRDKIAKIYAISVQDELSELEQEAIANQEINSNNEE